MSKITTLLIANRGEIACRVIRTAKAMGIRTVAVYSDADVNAPHVKLADEAIRLGPAPVGESYLLPKKILEAAAQTGADAIHPGYGFLSENAAFAKAVQKAGLIFVGPPEKAIKVMGDKARSKRAMIKAGVPCIPGYQGEDQSDAVLIKEAKSVGFPLMVKAAAGGGGRGMRLVHDTKDLPNAIKLARSEAENAFGSGELIIERAILQPRHVEVQVFGDSHGNIIHLGERDCSVQRRHQKVIEEAPCPVMTPKLRAAMGKAAVEAANAVDYVGAGTVEFLLDASGDFFFLEMNTRLQVEHPVTELVTGLDLVALQLRVAAGEPLGLVQDDVALTGHAIEVRLYAEDPADDFLPSTGPVHMFHTPEGEGIRVDSGIETGGEVSPFYDAMVAKVIAYGATRDEARLRLLSAMKQTTLFGPKTNRDFLIDALAQPGFASGEATTAFIGEVYGEDGYTPGLPADADLAIGAVISAALSQRQSHAKSLNIHDELLGWSSGGKLVSVMVAQRGEDTAAITLSTPDGVNYVATVADTPVDIEITDIADHHAKLRVEGTSQTVIFKRSDARTLHLATPTRAFVLQDMSAAAGALEEAGGGRVVAPMHGRLLEIMVKAGDTVTKGDKLAVLEAMKMQHELLAEVDGTVIEVSAKADAQIAADDLILEIEPAEEEA